MLRASHVAGVSRQDCRALFANERCRASARAMRRWETSSGAPETGLEHCAWSLSAPRLLGAGSTRPQGGLGWWAVTWAMGAVRAGAHEGDAWRGAGYGLVHPRVLTAWEGRLCVARARGVLPCFARFLVPQAPSRARACLDCRGGEATDIEWNGGTACKEKRALSSPSLIETNSHPGLALSWVAPSLPYRDLLTASSGAPCWTVWLGVSTDHGSCKL